MWNSRSPRIGITPRAMSSSIAFSAARSFFSSSGVQALAATAANSDSISARARMMSNGPSAASPTAAARGASSAFT